jgi:ElaB/YqjD/DUF883 family membrane-anchored ribosome-binding protein
MKTRNGIAESPEQLVTHLRDLLTEAEQLVGDSAGEYAGEKADALRERLSQAQERLQQLYRSTRDKVVAGARSTDTAIRAHPYESMALALGVGLLIGTVVHRRSN